MKTRRVKIHDQKWFSENCKSDHRGDYFKDGEWFINSKSNCIIGKVISQLLSTGGHYISDDYIFNIPEWAIEREITETDDFFDEFITYIKDTPKAHLMEEWSKHEKWDEVGPTIKELMNNLNK